jgi:hypothetical protein
MQTRQGVVMRIIWRKYTSDHQDAGNKGSDMIWPRSSDFGELNGRQQVATWLPMGYIGNFAAKYTKGSWPVGAKM